MSNWDNYKRQLEGVKDKKRSIIQSVSTDGLVSLIVSDLFRAQRFGHIPSYQECLSSGVIQNVVVSKAKNADILFISHRWFEDNPDDQDGSCLSVLKTQASQYEYLWVDYACFDMQIGLRNEMQTGLSLLLSTKTDLCFHNSRRMSSTERLNSAWSRLEVLCFVVKCELFNLPYDKSMLSQVLNSSRSVRIRYSGDKVYVDRFRKKLSRSISNNVSRNTTLLNIGDYLHNLVVIAEL